ncbi:small membrane A-kinase anchor protein [Nycticebus coucang]|uniref:small membrane A-kinase anchor protein n=1 Tax=Nycticebus coucang TaxID=9470 RepID=UPI00234C565C|nr:small membrane A-kinase anchor protein [Nycticebus coucang]XP_053454192.1 small membrane A-kinase anchor protein [Nycticebus coucang]
MGCMKSKQTFPFPTPLEAEKQHENEGSIRPEERPKMASSPGVKEEAKGPSGTSTVVLEYAHRLSQEILRDALKQWAFANVEYSDFPYIESEDTNAVG